MTTAKLHPTLVPVTSPHLSIERLQTAALEHHMDQLSPEAAELCWADPKESSGLRGALITLLQTNKVNSIVVHAPI